MSAAESCFLLVEVWRYSKRGDLPAYSCLYFSFTREPKTIPTIGLCVVEQFHYKVVHELKEFVIKHIVQLSDNASGEFFEEQWADIKEQLVIHPMELTVQHLDPQTR